MYQVIIIDDEYYARQRIRHAIDWSGLGFEVSREAESGREALEAIRHCRPDLAVVDISMPEMTGLDFIGELKTIDADIQTLILTGHDKFEYAKAAIALGVSDYLLKPVNEDELYAAAEKIKVRIDERYGRKTLLSKEKLARKYELYLEIMRSTRNPDGGYSELFERYGIKEDMCFRVVMLGYGRAINQLDDDEMNALHNTAEGVFTQEFADCATLFSIDLYKNDVVILETSTIQESVLWERLQKAVSAIRTKAPSLPLFVGCSGLVKASSLDLRTGYYQAESACLSRFTQSAPDGFYLFCNEPVNFMDREILEFKNKINRYKPISTDSMNSAITDLFRSIRENTVSIASLKSILTDIENFFLRTCAECDRSDFDNMFTEPEIDETLHAAESLADIEEIIARMGKDVSKTLQQRQKGYHDLVKQVISYIADNYSNTDFSLDLLSCALFASPQYLSMIFKRETGLSIIQYLTKERMEKAHELILNSCDALSKIAESVGYRDTFYFSKCFKKHFGCTPSDCKNIP